jgi:hypothetical protein
LTQIAEVFTPEYLGRTVIVRSGYSFDLISGTLSPGNWSVVSGNVESFGLNSVLFLDYELKVGNVIRLAVQGTTFCVYLNGVLLGSAVDNDNYYSSGTPALDIFNPGVSLESAALVNFAGGSVSNATSNRFTFIEDQNSTSSAVLYDVVDSGDGKTVGQTFWDNVVAQAWSFNLRDNQPYIAAGSADAAEIQGFIATLAEPDVPVYDSTVPASTRFSFSAIVRRSGQPALQYLVSDGPSSAYGSAGQIIWDGVNDRF